MEDYPYDIIYTAEAELAKFKPYSRKEVSAVFDKAHKKFRKYLTKEQLRPSAIEQARKKFINHLVKINKNTFVKPITLSDWFQTVKKELKSYKPYSKNELSLFLNTFIRKIEQNFIRKKSAKYAAAKEFEKIMMSVFEKFGNRYIIIQPEKYDGKLPHFLFGSSASFVPKKTPYYYIHKILFYAGVEGLSFLLLSPGRLFRLIDKRVFKILRGEYKMKQPLVMSLLKIIASIYNESGIILLFAIIIILLPLSFLEKIALKPLKNKAERSIFKLLVGCGI